MPLQLIASLPSFPGLTRNIHDISNMYQSNWTHMSENQWRRQAGRLEKCCSRSSRRIGSGREIPLITELFLSTSELSRCKASDMQDLTGLQRLQLGCARQGRLAPVGWFVEKMYHFSHLTRGTLDSCHRQKLEEDGSWTRARTLVARSLRWLEFRQWERWSDTQRCKASVRSVSREQKCRWKRGWAKIQDTGGAIKKDTEAKVEKLHHDQIYRSREISLISSQSQGLALPWGSLWAAAYRMKSPCKAWLLHSLLGKQHWGSVRAKRTGNNAWLLWDWWAWFLQSETHSC